VPVSAGAKGGAGSREGAGSVGAEGVAAKFGGPAPPPSGGTGRVAGAEGAEEAAASRGEGAIVGGRAGSGARAGAAGTMLEAPAGSAAFLFRKPAHQPHDSSRLTQTFRAGRRLALELLVAMLRCPHPTPTSRVLLCKLAKLALKAWAHAEGCHFPPAEWSLLHRQAPELRVGSLKTVHLLAGTEIAQDLDECSI
jgi:hypothetical protein